MWGSSRHRVPGVLVIAAALLWSAPSSAQSPIQRQDRTLETPKDWERQASAALATLLGSEQGEFDQDIYDKTLHDINDLHTDPEMVKWHVEHARLQLKIEQQEQERRERRAALDLTIRRQQADAALRRFNRQAAADGVWTAEEIDESDRLHDLAIAAWEPTANEQEAMAAYDQMRQGVVTAIKGAALHMGRLSPEEIAERKQNALVWDAATRTWRRATFTGQMVDEVHNSMTSQREIGIRATNIMIAAELYMASPDISEEQRAVAQQIYDMAHRTRGYAAEAISKDIALIMFGTAADVALLGPVGRAAGFIGGKAGQGAKALWVRLFGEATESAATGAASAGTASAGAATAETAAGRTAAETATTVRVPHAEAGAAAAADRTGSSITPEAQALYRRAIEKGRELGVNADELKHLEDAVNPTNPAIGAQARGAMGLEARQVLHGLDDVERVLAEARRLGVAEAEIQAALARARAAGTPEAFVYQLGDDVAVALANRQGVTILVAQHEARAFAEFTKHVPAARVVQMDAAALVRLDTKIRLAARGMAVEWSAAERALIDQVARYIRQGGTESLLKWAEFSGLDRLTPVFRPDFVKLFEQVFGTSTSRTAAATAPTVRLGAEAAAEATAPTVRMGAEATAPTVRTGAEATAPTVRMGAEATAPTVRTGAEATAPTVRTGAEATAPTVRTGAEATAPTVRVPPPTPRTNVDATPTVRIPPPGSAPTVRTGAEATAPTVRTGAEATAPTVRTGAEATAPTVRTGAEATAPTVRTDAEATAPTVRLGAEATAPTVRLGAEATAPTVRMGAEATAPTVPTGGAAAPVAGAGVAGLAGASTAEAAVGVAGHGGSTGIPPLEYVLEPVPDSEEPDKDGGASRVDWDDGFDTVVPWDDGFDTVVPGDDGFEPDKANTWDDGFEPTALNPDGANAAPADPTVQKMISVLDELQPIPALGGGAPRDALPMSSGPSADPAGDIWLAPLSASAGEQRDGTPPIRMFVTSLGTSTGEAFQVQIVNDGDRPVRIAPGSLVLEPIAGGAAAGLQRQVQQLAGSPNVASLSLTAYCLEFVRRPPSKGLMFRVAGRNLQERFAPMRSVLHAAKKLQEAGLLKADSDPTAYFHAIRQWTIWTREQNFDLKRFEEAFVERTKQNLEELGQNWSKEIEQAVRARVPGRWTDIQQVLREAETIERQR